MRPTVFLGHKAEDGGAWTARDRELAKALALVESETCRCGHRLSETLDPMREGWYDVHEDICAACLALEKHTAKKGDREPGSILSVRLDPAFHEKRAG